jgi:hypothetical protein
MWSENAIRTDYLDKRTNLRTLDMRLCAWEVGNLYRAGSLMTVTKQISKFKSDLVGVQEARWDRRGTEPGGKYTCFYGKGKEHRELRTDSIMLMSRQKIQSIIWRAASTGELERLT